MNYQGAPLNFLLYIKYRKGDKKMKCKICGNEIENEDEEMDGICDDCRIEE